MAAACTPSSHLGEFFPHTSLNRRAPFRIEGVVNMAFTERRGVHQHQFGMELLGQLIRPIQGFDALRTHIDGADNFCRPDGFEFAGLFHMDAGQHRAIGVMQHLWP